MRYTIIPLLVLVLASCAEDREVPAKSEATTAQFRMALRTEPYEPGDALISGEFAELNLHTFPVTASGGPGELVSCSDGVVLRIKWDEARIQKHGTPLQSYLMIRGLSYRICNRLVSPFGSSWRWDDWSEPSDVGLTRSWDQYVTPVPTNPSVARSPVLVLQWRWTGDTGYVAEDFLVSVEHQGLDG